MWHEFAEEYDDSRAQKLVEGGVFNRRVESLIEASIPEDLADTDHDDVVAFVKGELRDYFERIHYVVAETTEAIESLTPELAHKLLEQRAIMEPGDSQDPDGEDTGEDDDLIYDEGTGIPVHDDTEEVDRLARMEETAGVQ